MTEQLEWFFRRAERFALIMNCGYYIFASAFFKSLLEQLLSLFDVFLCLQRASPIRHAPECAVKWGLKSRSESVIQSASGA